MPSAAARSFRILLALFVLFAISGSLISVARADEGWVIESFEPQTRVFELTLKLGDDTQALRPRIEQVLGRFQCTHELRGASPDEVSYFITTPRELATDRVSNALTALVPDGKGAVEWTEKKARDKAAA